MLVKYEVAEGDFKLDDESYRSYGLVVKEDDTTLKQIDDVSLEKNDVVNLVKLCNKLELSPVHIDDVIEDFMAE